MTVANPDRTQIQAVELPETTTEYVVVNDPDAVDAYRRVDGTQIPDVLRERLKEPLFYSELPGPAKRFQKWTNETSPRDTFGPAVLRTREVTRAPWRTITGTEWDGIDDGRKANG